MKNETLKQIAIGVIIAIIAGGSPWWLEYIQENKPNTIVCEVDNDFSVIVNFNKNEDLKNLIKDELKTLSYYGKSNNTTFSEYEDAGKPGTIWIVYPQCIPENDARLQKVVNTVRTISKFRDKNIVTFAHKEKTFIKNVQVSIF